MANPVLCLNATQRWWRPLSQYAKSRLGDYPLDIRYSTRAAKKLQQRTQPLIVEIQIYFSCVVQKRILFLDETNLEATTVGENLAVVLRTVRSDVCDPHYFAAHHPIAYDFESKAAQKMHPSLLIFDYQHRGWGGKGWIGNFQIG